MFVHFVCTPPCQKIYGVRTDDPLGIAAPVCRACTKVTRMSGRGTGAKTLRKGAIEITAAFRG